MKKNNSLGSGQQAGRSRDGRPAPAGGAKRVPDCTKGPRKTAKATCRERTAPCRLGDLAVMLEEPVAVRAEAPGRLWVLVSVVPGDELAVVDRLAQRGVFAFTPVRQVWRWRSAVARRRGERKQRREVPVAPGYVVAGLDDLGRGMRRWVSVFSTAGVLSVHEGGRGPLALPASAVRLVAALADAAPEWEALMPSRREYAPGDAVVVVRGPLAGLQGCVATIRGGEARLALEGVLAAAGRVWAPLMALEAV